MRLPLFAACFAACGVSLVAAQPSPGAKAGQPVETLPAIFAPRAPPPDPKPAATSPIGSPPPARRVISPEMAAKLSAVAARAVATAPSGAASATTPPPAEASDAVQLKPFIVREEREVPAFKERDMLTPKGKLALARRRYPGLGPLTDAAALRMLEEDFAKERRQEMAELSGLLEIGGARPSGELKRKIDEASMLPSSFSPQIGQPFRTPR